VASYEYGVDLVTFLHPGYWGQRDAEQMLHWCREHPRRMWTAMLDALTRTGVTALELTFPPLDYSGAVESFGSIEAFGGELARRGLRVVSVFHNGVDWLEMSVGEVLADVADVADFLAPIGATVLVLGTPMLVDRQVTEEGRDRLLEQLARRCEAAGALLRERGLGLAVHTESHSLTVTARDLRRLMATTSTELVGLCPDAAHLTLSGADPVAVAGEFADRVLISHWKDAAGPMPAWRGDGDIHAYHRRFMRRLGDGVVDWEGWAKVMDRTPTAGVRLLELDAAADPVAELIRARRRLDRPSQAAKSGADGRGPGRRERLEPGREVDPEPGSGEGPDGSAQGRR